MPDGTQPQLESNIEPIEIQEEMERSFLDYAMSVITSRALPDARDGLKPVQRRILYGMYEGGLRPERNYKKCASAVGDVMGKYHPHGDQSIYDALARMAQDFSLRYPLVDGHGNFGSPDPNDRPAAMRYCISGASRVLTGAGTVRIDAIADAEPSSETPIDLKVLDRDGNPVRASKFFHSGDHPTRRLRTREGYESTGTHNHPVLCLERIAGVPVLQWKLLEEIEPGTVDPHRAYLDGRPTRRHRGGSSRPRSWPGRWWRRDGRRPPVPASTTSTSSTSTPWSRPGTRWWAVVGISTTDDSRRVAGSTSSTCTTRAISPRRRSAELVGLKSAEKRVPEFVWRTPRDAKQVFLQALFEGDGSCSDAAAATRSRSRTPRAASNSPVTCSGSCSSSA